jgi:hypothetical protein
LPASDIGRGPFGDIAELKKDEGVLLAEAFSVGQVTTLDRNNDQFSYIVDCMGFNGLSSL